MVPSRSAAPLLQLHPPNSLLSSAIWVSVAVAMACTWILEARSTGPRAARRAPCSARAGTGRKATVGLAKGGKWIWLSARDQRQEAAQQAAVSHRAAEVALSSTAAVQRAVPVHAATDMVSRLTGELSKTA